MERKNFFIINLKTKSKSKEKLLITLKNELLNTLKNQISLLIFSPNVEMMYLLDINGNTTHINDLQIENSYDMFIQENQILTTFKELKRIEDENNKKEEEQLKQTNDQILIKLNQEEIIKKEDSKQTSTMKLIKEDENSNLQKTNIVLNLSINSSKENPKKIESKIIQNQKVDVIKQVLSKQILVEDSKKIIDDKYPLQSITLNTLTSVKFEKRDDVLKTICENLEKEDLKKPLLPNEKSIALENSAKEIRETLEKIETPKEFLETTEANEMNEIVKQIESITGYNMVTNVQTPINKIKVDSTLLESSKILELKENDLKESIRKDIAKLYGIDPKDVYIRRIVRGSIEVYFSIPNGSAVNTSNLNQSTLPSFNSILQANGINKYSVTSDNILPNPQKAKEMLENYSRPLLIKTDQNKSLLMSKYGKYLPVLASLSSHIRVVHNSQTESLEIHGPPSEKAKVLDYFAQLEDLLQNTQVNVEIIAIKPILKINYYDELWIFLFDKAKDFVIQNYVSPNNTLQTNTININYNLKYGCPAAESFISALRNLNLINSSKEHIFNQGIFGWHGTRADENVRKISFNNLDIRLRNGQSYGPGEYFATNAQYSQGGFWGNTNTLFVFFILKNNNPYYNLNTHYVINNPSQNEMYVVPILIATFNNRTPIDIKHDSLSKLNYKWEWKGDDGYKEMGIGQPITEDLQMIFEENFVRYQQGGNSKFTLTIKRINDNTTQPYIYDFSTMKQTNVQTGYVREIRRITKA